MILDATHYDRERAHFLFLNAGHFIDHLMTLVFATVAALALSREWNMSYDALVPYATPGFVAFGVFSLPAGWMADRWNRRGMMAVFFIGIGLSAIATGFAQSPLQIAIGLFAVGAFAAIYHPVGLAMVVEGAKSAGMAIGINGVWGNLGVGSAALITGFFIDHGGWRAAFIVPGLVSVAMGIAHVVLYRDQMEACAPALKATVASPARRDSASHGAALARVSAIIFFAIALSSVIFQSTGFALPKIFAERLTGIAGSATVVGWLAFLVFAVASAAQLVTGHFLDRVGPKRVFLVAAGVQAVFFALMPGLTDWPAVIVALAFMAGAFGQIPITDYMIGKMARAENRSAVYGARYVVTFVVFATTVPLIAWVHTERGVSTRCSGCCASRRA